MRFSLGFQHRLQRLVWAILFIYFAVYGATWDGVLDANRHYPTLVLLAILVVLWLGTHIRRGWTWHTTPFDLIFVGWVVAFLLSVVANGETWRRSAEALWYMGFYIAVWYVLTDVISNGVRRQYFIDALLIVGLLQVIFAGLQVMNFYNTGGNGFPRPVGTFGNPNTLGAFLVLIIPLVISQVLHSKGRVTKIILGLYALVALLLLLGTFSRGAWVGTGVGLLLVGVLSLAHWHMLSRHALRQWWQAQVTIMRMFTVIFVASVIVMSVAVVVFTLQSFSIVGRSGDLRTLLWQFALQLFGEHPLFGTGLFTYGHHLPLLWSIPPLQPHSHPHNAVLLIMAELGLVGLSVLSMSVFFVWRMTLANWRNAMREQPLFVGAIGAFVGFGVHHLFDTPSMLPIIALSGLLIMIVVVMPLQPRPMQARWRVVGHPFGMAVIWGVLILVGLWQTGIQLHYLNTLEQTAESGDFAQGAQDLAQVLQSDPNQSAYLLQRAYFLGRVATDDASVAPLALEAYRVYVRLEPYHASAWANIAALAWQIGDSETAKSAIERAITLAPEEGVFQRLQAIYHDGTIFDDSVFTESVYTPNTAYYQYLRYIFTNEWLPQLGRGR
jgi:hypothetical protein